MELHWTRTMLTWLGYHPDHAPKDRPRDDNVPDPVRDLGARLLAVGGTCVVIPFGELFQLVLVEKCGSLLTVPGVVMKRGERNQCHANCARLWREHPDRYRLGMGWVLDDDDLWRCHTWLVDDRGWVVETTGRREQYFGVVLDREESEGFVRLIEKATGRQPLRGRVGPSGPRPVCGPRTGCCPCCGDRSVPVGPKIEAVKHLLETPTTANDRAPAVPTVRFEARCTAWTR